MASTYTVGRVKLVYKGNYDPTSVYSKGDIVNFVSDNATNTTKLFMYKNSGDKIGSNPIIRVATGTISSLAVRTNSVTITFTNYYNPGGGHNYYIVPTLTYLYSKYFPVGTVVTNVASINSTQVTLTLSEYSTNTSTITNDIATIGPRRVGNRYDRVLNTVDWDVYSEGSVFRGSFSTTGNYDTGDIVVENNQSYICVSPVGYGTGNVGPSSIAPVPDPEFDYLGVWDNYSGYGVNKDKKIITFANRNPFDWKGHPFIKPPTTGGTTSSGVSSTYQGGIPWTSPSIVRNSEHAWRWNGNLGAKSEHYLQIGAIDGEGRQLIIGGEGEYAVNHGGGAADDGYGLPSEGDSYSNNSYWTNDSPAPGGQVWGPNGGNYRPKNKPHVIQYLHTRENRLYLLSNGTVAIAGRTSALGAFANATDTSTNAALEIPRSTFQDRSIVKIACSDNAPANDAYAWGMALDEYGELWVWGNNNVGQLGLANEIITPKETYEGVSALGIGHEYGTTGQDAKHYSPYKLPSTTAFGGARIVDMCCGMYAAYALDENGYLWSWGYNNYGQLGYSTNSGFNSTDRSRAPRRITSALGYTWANYNANSGLEGTVTTTPTNITTVTTGKSFTKSAGGAAWNAQVYSSTAYTSSVAVSFKAGQTTARLMAGLNSDPTTDASYTSIDFCWYIQNGAVANIYESGSSIALDKSITYTANSVFSIVYDANEGYVNYYFDLDGDGKYVQLIRRVLKTASGGNSQATALYFDSSFYDNTGNLNSISISSGLANVTQRTWATYGGVQKFSASNCNTSYTVDHFTVLDGQGNIWNCGANGNGQCGDGTVTDGNNTSNLRKRKFGATGIAGNINNFWMLPGSNTFFSVSTTPTGHSNIWGVGINGNYQLTTNNATDQSTPVQIKASTLRTDNSIATNNFMKDIVAMCCGGSSSNTNNEYVFYALDAYGYVYSAGYDYNGASGSLADGTNNQYVTQNISKMQHTSGDASSSWPRVYMPNTQYGKVIDIYLTGVYTDYQQVYYPGSPGYPYSPGSGGSTVTFYQGFSHGAFLTSDGSLLSCGSNDTGYRTFNFFPNQGDSIRVPQYHHQLGG